MFTSIVVESKSTNLTSLFFISNYNFNRIIQESIFKGLPSGNKLNRKHLDGFEYTLADMRVSCFSCRTSKNRTNVSYDVSLLKYLRGKFSITNIPLSKLFYHCMVIVFDLPCVQCCINKEFHL